MSTSEPYMSNKKAYKGHVAVANDLFIRWNIKLLVWA